MWRRCRDACCGWARSLFPGVPCGEAPSPPDPLPASGEREQKRRSGYETPGVSAKLLLLSIPCGRERLVRAAFMRGAKVDKTNMSRRLRRNATIAEQRLWYRLRSRSLYGMKFVRQEPIGPYIVDFVCREQRL